MTDETLTTEPQPQPAPLPLRFVTADDGSFEVRLGQSTIASCDQSEWGRISRNFVQRMPARMNSLAWIGAGTCIGPRLCKGRMAGTAKQDIYELRPALINRLKAVPGFVTFLPGWNFIAGDYQTTLTGLYDVIIFDAGGVSNNAILQAHLNPGGLLLGTE